MNISTWSLEGSLIFGTEKRRIVVSMQTFMRIIDCDDDDDDDDR